MDKVLGDLPPFFLGRCCSLDDCYGEQSDLAIPRNYSRKKIDATCSEAGVELLAFLAVVPCSSLTSLGSSDHKCCHPKLIVSVS